MSEAFDDNARPPMDGNAWLDTIEERDERLATAQEVRYGYEFDDLEDEMDEPLDEAAIMS